MRIEHHDGVALRASFLIDKAGLVQHQVVNNLSLGRNVGEMIRMVDALQFSEQHGQVCALQAGKVGRKAFSRLQKGCLTISYLMHKN